MTGLACTASVIQVSQPESILLSSKVQTLSQTLSEELNPFPNTNLLIESWFSVIAPYLHATHNISLPSLAPFLRGPRHLRGNLSWRLSYDNKGYRYLRSKTCPAFSRYCTPFHEHLVPPRHPSVPFRDQIAPSRRSD